MPQSPTIHGTCVARGTAGVLLLGAPGTGKSSLALRLIDRGWSLVADDQVHIASNTASPPASLAGLLEIAGLGIAKMPYLPSAQLALVAQLAKPARLPMPTRYEVLDLPLISVDPFTQVACLIMERALDAMEGKLAFTACTLAP